MIKKFFKNARRKGPEGKILEFFFLDTLKTRFLMEYLTQHYQSLFSQNQGNFLDFQKRTGEASPPLPTLSCAPVLKTFSRRLRDKKWGYLYFANLNVCVSNKSVFHKSVSDKSKVNPKSLIRTQ